MVYRVEKFLGYFPLEGFGVVIGWFSLILCVVSLLLFTAVPLLFYLVIPLFLMIGIILIGLLVALMYYSKQFVDGINQRNHRKMEVYRIFFVIKVVLSVVVLITSLWAYVCGLFAGSADKAQTPNVIVAADAVVDDLALSEVPGYNSLPEGPSFPRVLAEALFLGVEMYLLVCINSLYLNIKEENCNTMASAMPSHDGTINQQQQQQLMMKPPAEYSQSYQAADEWGQSSHVGIPMQQ